MKRIAAVAFLFALLTVPAFAYMSSGKIDGEPGWSFRDLSINNNQVSVAIENETDKAARFWGTLFFLDIHGKPVAQTYVFNSSFGPKTRKFFTQKLHFGDTKSAKEAFKLIWGDVTIEYQEDRTF
ncbi:MAG: hypothetical protein LBC93_03555 [Synergistaceae bacterium]|jgi:hypothetical protein|nr:hypothetical protein [Synergistaceae bacterium]